MGPNERCGFGPIKCSSRADLLLRVLNLLFQFAIRCSLIDKVPFSIEKLYTEQKIRPILELKVASRFRQEVMWKGRTNSLPWQMAIRQGLRESEVLNARWEFLDNARGIENDPFRNIRTHSRVGSQGSEVQGQP